MLVIERIGRISFSIFFLHIAVIYLIRYSIVTLGKNVTMPLTTPLMNPFFLVSFILFFFLLERWWSARQYRYGFEWVLRTVPSYITRVLTK
jgi:peptidoglycan/LPS O-acetylase OafA/YrhL